MGKRTSVTYRSTRGGVKSTSFLDAALEGLASDGGLFVPNKIPRVDNTTRENWRSLSFTALALEVFSRFVAGDQIPRADRKRLIDSAFSKFRVMDVVPLKLLEPNFYLLELFHGPTFAFKDIAMTMLGELFEYVLQKQGKDILVLGATSGDTGSSAMAALLNRPRIKCLILYPQGRTSKVQEAQMWELANRENSNVCCVPVTGTFDDCQRIVKECFKSPLRTALNLAAVNSMNWVRVMTQIVYYWWASLRTNSECIDVCIPTGNFGNALAAWFAREMGAPIRQIVIATNANDILAQFMSSGSYLPSPVIQTLSPSMDIQIASNFERFVDFLYNKDSKAVAASFEQLARTGSFEVPKKAHELAQTQIFGFSSNDEETLEEIKNTYKKCGVVLDPHTAVAVSVCRRMGLPQGGGPVVVPATAHFGKFPEAIVEALGSAEFNKLLIPDALRVTCGDLKISTCEPTFSAVSKLIKITYGPPPGVSWWKKVVSNPENFILPLGLAISVAWIFAGRQWYRCCHD